MNEIRDLIVGIDFGKEYSQICYYDRKGDEARSLSMKAGGNQYEAPCILCWRPEQKDYCVGLEADYFVREKGGVMIDDVYGICEKSDSVLVEGQELAPWEILAQFLQGMLKFLGVAELVKNTKCVAVTLPGLTEIQVENFQKAFEIIGFPHRNICCWIMGKASIIMCSHRKEKPGTAVWDGMPLHRRTCLFAR